MAMLFIPTTWRRNAVVELGAEFGGGDGGVTLPS